jgi:HSP20 family molecular chaperone IbpA
MVGLFLFLSTLFDFLHNQFKIENNTISFVFYTEGVLMKKLYFSFILSCLIAAPLISQTPTQEAPSFFDDIHQGIGKSMREFEKTMHRFAETASETGKNLRNKASNILASGMAVHAREDQEAGVYRIEASVPGFKKGEVKALLERFVNGVTKVTIVAESKQEETTTTENGQGSERSSYFGCSKAEQTMPLPNTIDSSTYTAKHEDGVFKLEFPLKKQVPSNVVEITIDGEKVTENTPAIPENAAIPAA